MRGNNPPDVMASFTSANVGTFCVRAQINLAPMMQASGVDASAFPKVAQYYTQYKGKRCALPLLADAYGLYYNKAIFDANGVTAPPKTLAELSDLAKKLTQRERRRQHQGGRLRPGHRVLLEERPSTGRRAVGAQWFDSKGQSISRHRSARGRS